MTLQELEIAAACMIQENLQPFLDGTRGDLYGSVAAHLLRTGKDSVTLEQRKAVKKGLFILLYSKKGC